MNNTTSKNEGAMDFGAEPIANLSFKRYNESTRGPLRQNTMQDKISMDRASSSLFS